VIVTFGEQYAMAVRGAVVVELVLNAATTHARGHGLAREVRKPRSHPLINPICRQNRVLAPDRAVLVLVVLTIVAAGSRAGRR
jgi:hypothetical protein